MDNSFCRFDAIESANGEFAVPTQKDKVPVPHPSIPLRLVIGHSMTEAAMLIAVQ